RTFTGCKASSFALLAQGLGVSALGINCSLGPIEILPIAKEIAQYTKLPIIIKANAGLPDPLTNTYDISPNEFAKQMLQYKELNVKYIGGCCGTTPKFIEALVNNLDYDIVKTNINEETYACTPTKCLNIKDVHVIGERINPTGNKRMKQALLDNNLNEILAIAIEQVDAGADILDVNVGLPGINEKEMMVALIKELQTIIDVPLQIDSTNPEVIEAALRAYNGIPIVNSVNGELAVMESILPSIAKYGSNIVGLTMNEAGIPKTAKERYNIAEYIITTASTYNIPKHRVFIDCLTLTVSAQQNAAQQTIEALTLVRKNLGVHTVLGVSNISFGLPNRTIINQSFLSIAMQAGLTMPIINPNRKEMMDAVRSFRVLNMIDIDCIDYINSYANMLTHKGVTPTNSTQAIKTLTIEEAIAKGLKDETRKLTEELLKVSTPLEIVDNNLIPALDIVGIKYENKEIYLPQLINAATASQCAFEAIKKHMLLNGGETISKGKIILATVKGDVHDIGKNIVKVVLENYGYQIIDLGKDVPIELVVSTAIKENVYLIGLSALMTTTLSSMEETVKALHESGHDCKIMVGGAVVSAEYAKSIKADYYARNAKESADIAKRVLK
ncbi:MAG: dihydropteroate synthase, partial [Erysipelotrichaceae bacterium]